MNLIMQYGLLGLVLGLGLGLGFILYCRIWRPLALPYMCPQPIFLQVEHCKVQDLYIIIVFMAITSSIIIPQPSRNAWALNPPFHMRTY